MNTSTERADVSWWRREKIRPWLFTGIVILAALVILRLQGQPLLCSCGRLLVWTRQAWSAETSQHLFDPYSFTHLLHGFVFAWLVAWVAARQRTYWQLGFAISIEALWELVENSEFVIRRYREATAALGYHGDSVVNSLGDLIACGIGFLVAKRLGVRWAIPTFILVDLTLLVLIKDSLILNVVMLLYPIDAIRVWQSGH